MRTTINDKLFFLDKVNATIFVDYGCADGSLFNEMIKHIDSSKEYLLIGYDINPDMIELANRNGVGDFDKVKIIYTSDFDKVISLIHGKNNVAVILSSVLHEIYSYAKNEDEIRQFYDNLPLFKWICLRDMMFSYSIDNNNLEIQKKILEHGNPKQIEDFCNKYGSLEKVKNQLHFLLKYRYVQNWNRELNENYFPVFLEDILDKLTVDFDCMYLERFQVPFIMDCIKNDFELEFEYPTHVKLILKNTLF